VLSLCLSPSHSLLRSHALPLSADFRTSPPQSPFGHSTMTARGVISLSGVCGPRGAVPLILPPKHHPHRRRNDTARHLSRAPREYTFSLSLCSCVGEVHALRLNFARHSQPRARVPAHAGRVESRSCAQDPQLPSGPPLFFFFQQFHSPGFITFQNMPILCFLLIGAHLRVHAETDLS
jgi:hypothetical protein